ncbi:hypothetical protein CAT24_09055 [Acinetobacter pittii]|uniref:hypothetical protein n=1 Tax=Acinetobacter calcoaceticus/baumannii complex TaxID=909768 RepID=UPI00044FA604|nr:MULTISPECIES: hypothetical protein [Acinetobacter calcoaceticus/baumannii complex]EXG33052.1 hypothetical protein J733_0916 [Acinetobacter sp. 263903-2]OTS02600.1 hypothetical protein CAT24_09055 [Acinetobacter pittii]
MTINPAQIYRDIFLSMTDRQDSHDYFVSWMQLDASLVDRLKTLNSFSLADGSLNVKVNGLQMGSGIILNKINEKYFNSKYIFEVRLNKNNINLSDNFIICEDWDTILQYDKNIKNPIINIFLTSDKVYLDIGSPDIKFKNYLALGELYSFLKYLSEESNSDKDSIFYNRSYKFKIKACEEDLNYEIDVKSLEKFKREDMHRAAIINLICKEVTSFIKDQNEEDRFSYLIRNINPLITHINHSYQSYVEDYTFDKVRKEYNEKKTEYIKKLNDTFDSVATKMFAIPAGIWFATAQIVPIKDVSNFLFTKNFFVLITVLSMVFIMILNIWSQRSTLIQMKEEYSDIFDELALKFEGEKDQIIIIKSDVDKRFEKISSYIYISIIVCIALAAYTLILFFQSI